MAAKDQDIDTEEEEQVELPRSDVIEKYKIAADIANRALAEVAKNCVPDKKIVDLCSLGDKFINDEVAKIYNKPNKDGQKVDKGVAFPTCISVNEIVGHFSPLSDDTSVLQEGDVVKIDLGAQVDGYISVVAATIIATNNPSTPTTGRKADVICAAHYAAEVALRLMKPGKKNTDVTAAIAKVAAQFKCEPMEGVLSHQMKRFVIDGNKVILNKATPEHKVEEFEFEENQCYAIDIVMSTGEGKSKEIEARTTIYKRAVDQSYLLKMKASRYVFNEINARFPTLPFTLRSMDEKRARLGITECLNHGLLQPYPVLYEKKGEYVAQFKFTVLILSSGTLRLNNYQLPYVSSEYKIEDPELVALLQTSTGLKKKKKKKSSAASSGGDASKAADKMDTQ